MNILWQETMLEVFRETTLRIAHLLPKLLALLTFLGVYVLTTLIAVTLGPYLLSWPLLMRNAAIAAIVVGALTWAIMPFLARNLHNWLFAEA